MKTDLQFIDNDGLYLNYNLTTQTESGGQFYVNTYRCRAKIGGLDNAAPSTKNLYLFADDAYNTMGENTNEETLTDEAIRDIFDELINK